MALIIKGDMPKACNWFDENGKHRFCKVNAFCDCRIYTRGKRPSDCPIIGEIPDKHGRLIDADAFWKRLQKQTMSLWTEKSKEYQYFLDVMDMIKSAPTIVEATE